MYSDILYPTDGSENANAALDDARDMAEKYGATVHVLYVLDTSGAGVGLGDDPDKDDQLGMAGHPEGDGSGMTGKRETGEQVRKRERERAETLVEDVADQFGDIETRPVVDSGTPHQTILDYANDNGIDMVVMSTHGRTGLDRYLLGSVTEKVVRLSEVPVLTVRGSTDA